jgi:hypothetical protein
MLTAVIRAPGPAEPLAATLTVLIAAVSEGFIGHAVIVAASENSGIAALADATGADLVTASGESAWSSGAAAARGDWVLLLEAGDIPDLNWVAVVERHLLVNGQRPALMPVDGLPGRLIERAACLAKPRVLRAGLIIARGAAQRNALSQAPVRLGVGRTRLVKAGRF